MKAGTEPFYPLKVTLGCLGYASYFLSKVIFVALIFPVFLIMLPFPRTQQLFLQVVTHRYLGFFSDAGCPSSARIASPRFPASNGRWPFVPLSWWRTTAA